MKFLAILRDSLRETLDVKLFYFLVALSVLICFVIGTVTYQPVTMERHLRFPMGILNFALRAQMQARPETQGIEVRLDVENIRQTNDAPEPWLGDYEFDYLVSIRADDKAVVPPDKDLLNLIKKDLRKTISERQLREDLERLFRKVEIRTAEDDPNEVRYRVKTEGTLVGTRAGWFHEPALFFGAVPISFPAWTLANYVSFFGNWVVGAGGGAFILLVSTVISASFLPNMLAKGSVDLLLVKPIYRTTLLLYKFVGGLLFVFLNAAVIMVGVWVGLGLQTGLWVNAFLVCVLIYTAQFAIMYSVSAVAAVTTRSAIVAILVSLMLWGFLVVFGWAHWGFNERNRDDPPGPEQRGAYITYHTLDALHAVLPRWMDLTWLTGKMIEEAVSKPADPSRPEQVKAYEEKLKDIEKRYRSYHWGSSLAVSGAFVAVMLGLACWRFAVKDY